MSIRYSQPRELAQSVYVLWGTTRSSRRGQPRVTHALDCRWAMGVAEKTNVIFRRVNKYNIPSSVGRCSHCGGGR